MKVSVKVIHSPKRLLSKLPITLVLLFISKISSKSFQTIPIPKDLVCEQTNKNMPYRWAVDGECHSEPLLADSYCKNPSTPYLCPAVGSNHKPECKKSYNDCNTIIGPCSKGNLPYSCSDGTCTSGAEACELEKDKLGYVDQCH